MTAPRSKDMNTRLIATLSTLTLAAFAGTAARADESEVTLEWQQPGYEMEVVRVTAKRPELTPEAGTEAAVMEEVAVTTDVTPAWQEPGYEPEIIVVTASRSEALADYRTGFRAWDARNPRWSARNVFGTPAR
jgi:hypothetical protein